VADDAIVPIIVFVLMLVVIAVVLIAEDRRQ
jgi:hypothetical protein